jgi:hypothetical protein
MRLMPNDSSFAIVVLVVSACGCRIRRRKATLGSCQIYTA